MPSQVKTSPDYLKLPSGNVMRGKRYNAEKQPHGGQTSNEKGSGQNVHSPEKTAERIAEQSGVDERTVRRDAKYAAGLGMEARDNKSKADNCPQWSGQKTRDQAGEAVGDCGDD